MVRGENVLLASPYIGLDYFQRIIDLSKSWRILTDVEEWLGSHNSSSRQYIKRFNVDNQQRIRHCKDLHAKVIVAGDRALVGSANLTRKGITKRFEVSVLFEKEPQVGELNNLLENLWLESGPVDVEELEAYIASMPTQSIDDKEEKPQAITSRAPEVRSELVQIPEEKAQAREAIEAQDQSQAKPKKVQGNPYTIFRLAKDGKSFVRAKKFVATGRLDLIAKIQEHRPAGYEIKVYKGDHSIKPKGRSMNWMGPETSRTPEGWILPGGGFDSAPLK